MLRVQSIPALLSVLVGLLIGIAAWGATRTRNPRANNRWWMETNDRLLLGMLMLAAFVLGVFVTYLLMVAV